MYPKIGFRLNTGKISDTIPKNGSAMMYTSGWPKNQNRCCHKTIGYMYLIASVLFFLLGGVMALIIRAELFEPGMQIIPTKEQYNQLFTMHGTIMLLMFATPLFAGFANAILPLQLGAPDVAFPRLNAFALWLFIFGSIIAIAGFLTPQGAAAFGWFAYQPLANASFSPGAGGNLWMLGLGMSGFGTILGAVNFITTIITMRAPGMTMWRLPIFSWNVLITSILVLMAFPVLAAATYRNEKLKGKKEKKKKREKSRKNRKGKGKKKEKGRQNKIGKGTE